ncbi:hypothetical protein LTR28_006879 [Elasticomyces elasticus]|nr:hypothetical protein LTR28_006879 [Elasticomyces elasticus]
MARHLSLSWAPIGHRLCHHDEVQGLGSPGGPENPIWTLAKESQLANTYSNYSSILSYEATGYVDYTEFINNVEDVWVTLDAAAEWWEWDWEYAYPPEKTSQVFGIANYNATFYHFSDANNYVFDQRGFNTFIKGEASKFLSDNDPRLLLNTVVRNITYNDTGVTIHNTDGTCISAAHAICTFSPGVLQHAPASVSFHPPLPAWKVAAIDSFQMGTYTKIFLQFNHTFWPTDTQFLLYADPLERGHYPVFQSLFRPGNIIFATVVQRKSQRAERMSDGEVRGEVVAVLRTMFPRVVVPEPTAFLVPRWSREPWAYGSYSDWPPGASLERHQNLRANVGALWFAGEATSAEDFGFLQGAYFEGRAVAERVVACLRAKAMGVGGSGCPREERYEVLRGVTPVGQYDEANGWMVGFLDELCGMVMLMS